MPLMVSLIILHYGAADDKLIKCLQSFTSQSFDSYEIILIWSCKPPSFDINGFFSQNQINTQKLELKLLEENLGYTGGNNYGARFAKGIYINIINPDVIIQSDYLSRMFHSITALEKKWGTDKILLSPRICNPTGDYEFARLFINFLGFSKNDNTITTQVQRTMINSGCSIFISKKNFYMLNGFRSDYFMYHDDSELAIRASFQGFKGFVDNSVKLWHLKSIQEYKMTSFKFFWWNRNRLRFTLEYASKKRRMLIIHLLFEPVIFVYALLNHFLKEELKILRYLANHFLNFYHYQYYPSEIRKFESISIMEGIFNEISTHSILFKIIQKYVNTLFYIYTK